VNIIVGAYAASPSQPSWQPHLEADYFARLAEVLGLRGLELPWVGRLHPHDSDWLLAALPSRFDLVVTDIGGTVGRLAADPDYGLASNDADGRRRALDDAARMRDDVDRLNQSAGRSAVIAVELHSAPLAGNGGPAAFAESLRELAGWQWGGAQLLVEHCDTLVDGRSPEKGYLPLAAEIDAIAGSDTAFGLSLNWGRSAIELRDADAVLRHVAEARGSGLLRAVVFSGASPEASAFGPAWVDAHLPFDADEPTSRLTAERAHATLDAAGDLDWVGIKLGHRPLDAPVADRVRVIQNSIALLDRD
jgi:hypothetical protein